MAVLLKKFARLLTLCLVLSCLAQPLAATQAALEPPAPAAHPGRMNEAGQVRAYDIAVRPLISFSFDDSSQTVYDTAYPIIDAQGIPATFFFISGFLTEQWKTQLNDLQNHGWEIGSHSVTHPDLTALDDDQLTTELGESQADLQAAGLAVNGFAYPSGTGEKDGRVIRRVEQFYGYARSVITGSNDPILDQYALKTRVLTAYTDLATIQGWVDAAIQHKQWLILTLHEVDHSGSEYSITPETFSALVNYTKAKIDAGLIEAVTVGEGYQRYSQTYWEPIETPGYVPRHKLALTNGKVLWLLGPEIADYLHDGHQWVRDGKLRYYELNGQYHTINEPSDISLDSIRPDYSTVRFKLSSTDKLASVVSTVGIAAGDNFARITTLEVAGSPTRLCLAKDLTRRFSIRPNEQRTDGLLEVDLRPYQESGRTILAFDTFSDQIRFVTQLKDKTLSEYSDYEWGEFRSSPINLPDELPYAWYVGGIPFDTTHLLYEAERCAQVGPLHFYTGKDASPKSDCTGVMLDQPGDEVTIDFAPPYPGDYTLSIRQKGDVANAQYSYRIDGGPPALRTVSGTIFGYENIPLFNLAAGSHTLQIHWGDHRSVIDYALLIPITRSPATPAAIEFPIDAANHIFSSSYLPAILK